VWYRQKDTWVMEDRLNDDFKYVNPITESKEKTQYFYTDSIIV